MEQLLNAFSRQRPSRITVFNIFNILLSLQRKVPILPRLPVSPEVSQAAGRHDCAQNGISTWLWKPCLPRLPEESKEGRLSSRGQIRAIQILLTDLLEKLPPLCPLHRDPEGATKPQPCVQARCTMPGIQCYSSY